MLEVDVRLRFPGFDLDVHFSLNHEIAVLYGPSGAGKSLTLSLIAGLRKADEGEIRFGSKVWFRRRRGKKGVWIPARKRKVGLVFQRYALFPHMTALENVMYAIPDRPDREAIARSWLRRLHLEHLAGHYPEMLSGGQQQRVAIARVLAMEPNVLLLDEPFSALDWALKTYLLEELKALHQARPIPTIYVTHQIEEATLLGHRLLVIEHGRIITHGPMDQILRAPDNERTAALLGLTNLIRMNVVAVSSHEVILDWEGDRLMAARSHDVHPGPAVVYIEPGDVKILYPDRPVLPLLEINRLPATIAEITDTPRHRRIRVRVGHRGQRYLEIHCPRLSYQSLQLEPGKEVMLGIRRDRLQILPQPSQAGPETGR